MKPDRYTVYFEGRHRLSGMIQQRGYKMGLSTAGGFLFGLPFVAIGTFVTLIGTKLVEVDPSTVHAPYWVLTVAGLCFALGGFAFWGAAFKQVAANRRRGQSIREHSTNPALAGALADYRWNPKHFEVSQWSGAAKSIGVALGMTLFLSMFNWWAFGSISPWPVKLIVGVFDCIMLWLWVYALMRVGRAFKFGKSRILFSPFPYQLPGPITIRWQSDGAISHIRKGTFTLRCVEEYVIRRGKNESAVVVHEELWSAAWALDKPRNLPLKESFDLVYELPADALPTQLAADKPVFWELAVHLDLAGLDFKETYLVPIYSVQTSSQKTAIGA